MKKSISIFIFCILALLLFFQSIQIRAAEEEPQAAFEFEKIVITDVVAKELNIAAKFNLTIKNRNIYEDYFKVYSLVDLKITPVSPTLIPPMQENTIQMEALPLRWLKEKGLHSIEYYIKGDRSGYLTDTITVKVLPLNEILIVNAPGFMSRDDTKIKIEIINKERIDFGEAQLVLHSDFFSTTSNMTIGPKSSQNITLDLDPNKLKTGKAGTYKLKATFFLNNEYNYTSESDIILQEYSNIKTEESSRFAFFSFIKTITKKNEGNIPKFVTIEAKKSRFERAFSSFSVPPTYERPAFMSSTIGWERELEPGESFSVEIKTDYTIFVIVLIVLIILIVTLYLAKRPRVIIRKKAIRVTTKGGEFALKVIVFVKNVGKEVQNVLLVDRLPHITKLYERFTVKPDKIEHNKLEWNFGSLASNEERVVSYIIYSKVIPVGTVELPQATIHYTDIKNKRKYTDSNKIITLSSS